MDSVGLLCTSILPYCIVAVHKCVVLVRMVCCHFLRVYTLLPCPDRTKIFIRFPQTLFDIEDKYQLRKHELGVCVCVCVYVYAWVCACVRVRVCVFISMLSTGEWVQAVCLAISIMYIYVHTCVLAYHALSDTPPLWILLLQ